MVNNWDNQVNSVRGWATGHLVAAGVICAVIGLAVGIVFF